MTTTPETATGPGDYSTRSASPCWWIYVLACENGSLYTGITTDVARRYQQHCAGKGARYTRSHRPSALLGALAVGNRAEASRLEHQVKQLAPADKRRLVSSWSAAPSAPDRPR